MPGVTLLHTGLWSLLGLRMDCKLSTPEVETSCVLVHVSWVLGENLSPSVGALRVGGHTSGPSINAFPGVL